MNGSPPHIQLYHNLQPERFMWLWMKYVTGINPTKHCTNCLRGRYSKLLSKHNPAITTTQPLDLREQQLGSFYALYICGVYKKGYPRSNYAHNLHAAILPAPDYIDEYEFEQWRLKVINGRFDHIPSEHEIPADYRSLAAEFTTCRIFRWAVCSEQPPLPQ